MGGKPVGVLLLLVGCVGCHACNNCCDYLPPVAEGPYTVPGGRAGSAFGGAANQVPAQDGPLPDPDLGETESVAEQFAVEPSHEEAVNRTLRDLLSLDQ